MQKVLILGGQISNLSNCINFRFSTFVFLLSSFSPSLLILCRRRLVVVPAGAGRRLCNRSLFALVIFSLIMDPRYTSEMFKHLSKQNELLMETYNSMSHELHKLQVEEEMLMRKFYEIMTAQGVNQKKEGHSEVHDGGETGDSIALLTNTSNASNDDENADRTALVPTDNKPEQ